MLLDWCAAWSKELCRVQMWLDLLIMLEERAIADVVVLSVVSGRRRGERGRECMDDL